MIAARGIVVQLSAVFGRKPVPFQYSTCIGTASAARSYLWGRWNSADNDGNPLTNYDDDPVARASFGLYGIDRVPNQFIYRRENY